jgi:hypothetical protein
VIVEPLHAAGIAPIYMYSSPYILRSGHGWACIASQKTALDEHVKGVNANRYAALHIETDVVPSTAIAPIAEAPISDLTTYLARLARVNQASAAILAQVGSFLRSLSGPFRGVRNMVLAGHSQTGFVLGNYINTVHASRRREDGAPVYDGFLPTGAPAQAFGPRDVPLIQVLSDGDVYDARDRLLDPGRPGRHYRRADSDQQNDQFRLYELAGIPHLGTRYPPHNDTKFSASRQHGLIKAGDRMNSLPHHELFNVALHHLIAWTANGVTPPRAEWISESRDHRYFAKDEHGNSIGGVRCVQMDVPRATYQPVAVGDQGHGTFTTIGTQLDFGADKMRQLYGSRANYVRRFNERLDELISNGWFLAEDADGMRAEAGAQQF